MTSVASMQLTASGADAVQIIPDDLPNPWAFSPLNLLHLHYSVAVLRDYAFT